MGEFANPSWLKFLAWVAAILIAQVETAPPGHLACTEEQVDAGIRIARRRGKDRRPVPRPVTGRSFMHIAEPGEPFTIPVSEFRSEIVKVHRPAPQAPHNTPRIRVVTDNGEQPREPEGTWRQTKPPPSAASVRPWSSGLDVTLVLGPAPTVPAGFPHRLVPAPWLVAEVPAAFSELGHFSAGHASRQARMQPPMSSAAAA